MAKKNMFANAVLFVVVSLIVEVISKKEFITKNGLTFEVDDRSDYSISHANIPTLQEGAISDIEDMRTLDLSTDNISTIEPGAFQYLPNLYSLKIYNNSIPRIEVGVFNDLNVTALDIGFNKISLIASHAFDNMKNLKILNLAGNNLNRWDVLWFVRTPSLKSFHMSFNKFEKIPAKAFGNQEKAGTYFIALNGNEIDEIDEAAFKGVSRISFLFLDLKNQSILKANSLRDIQIDELVIKVNGIYCLPEEIFNRQVTINGNSTQKICKDSTEENVNLVKEEKHFY